MSGASRIAPVIPQPIRATSGSTEYCLRTRVTVWVHEGHGVRCALTTQSAWASTRLHSPAGCFVLTTVPLCTVVSVERIVLHTRSLWASQERPVRRCAVLAAQVAGIKRGRQDGGAAVHARHVPVSP